MTRLSFSRAFDRLRESLRTVLRRRPASRPAGNTGGPQRALTLAAMALPGMALAAQPEEALIQYSNYQEGGRDAWRGPDGTVNVPDPISVDTLHDAATGWLSDRLKLVFNYLQDTWSGATPILTAPEAFLTVSGASAYPRSASFADGDLVPYGPDASGTRVAQPELIHMLSSASAETRRQADFTLTREWDEMALDLGAGVSDEPDFTSHFGSINARRDFNQKLTTVNVGLSYTDSDVEATLGPVVDWTDYGYYLNATDDPKITIVESNGQQIQVFSGNRTEWSAAAGLTQVLGRNSTLSTGLAFTRSSGFLENPYKLVMVAFADPGINIGGLDLTRLFNVPENRPDERNLWTWNTEFSHYFAAPDAALHLDYRLSHDDWSITSHTLEASWSQGVGASLIVAPRIRYYSQDAADFYRPYFIFGEAAPVQSPGGPLDFTRFPVDHYASDHRLSGFGALSAGITLTKRFGNGVSLEGGAEYYEHGGDLKLGGGGEDAYADFDYYVVNLALKIDLGSESPRASTSAMTDPGGEHAGHEGHAGHDLPGGLMYGHMLEKANDFMLGYRYVHDAQSGDTLHGSHATSDAEILANGCGAIECTVTAQDMTMNMQMVDVMYAPTDWLTLMTMFQFMDMEMKVRLLEGAVIGGGSGGHQHGAGGHNRHTTAGIGDTVVAAMVRLVNTPGTDLHAGLGVSVPTGDVDIELSDGEFQHYGMQTGSGTWDWQPSLTYAGRASRWSWGGQLSGIIRGDGPNKSGYTLGDVFQSTAWTNYRFTNWLSASARGVYTSQGKIDGEFEPAPAVSGPMDLPGNYGGSWADVGVGLSAAVPGRSEQGDRILLEWLEPVSQDLNGYQLERDGTLAFSWTFSF